MAKRVLMIAGDYTEDYEVMVPYQALEMAGVQVDVVCPGKTAGECIQTAVHDFGAEQTYSEKPGHLFKLNASFDYLKLTEYDGLYLTGGRGPEYLRRDPRVLDLVRFFFQMNLPVAAICHGVQILTAADVLEGRILTAYDAVAPEVTMAKATYMQVPVTETVVDGNLVTSPAWPGHITLLREFLKLLHIIIFES